MVQELDRRILQLRVDLTRLVRGGLDEDGTELRRMLAELERLENLRSALRHQTSESITYPIALQGDRSGGAHARFAA